MVRSDRVISEELKGYKVTKLKRRGGVTCDRRRPPSARSRPGCGQDSGLVSGHALAEAAWDQVEVFLSFVPFQNPDRNTQRSRLNWAESGDRLRARLPSTRRAATWHDSV